MTSCRRYLSARPTACDRPRVTHASVCHAQINVERAAVGVKDLLLRDAFSVLDGDGDGRVATGDILADIARLNVMSAENVQTARAMLELNDKDGDGLLSYDEYVRFLSADPGFSPWDWLRHPPRSVNRKAP